MMTRKQSLVNQSTNPFVVVIQKLDQLPNNINDITREQIVSLTEPLIGGWAGPDEMMALAKTASRTLFVELEPNERVHVINNLVSEAKKHYATIKIDGFDLNSNCRIFSL